jgi:anaerobic selenocysteine-containing dehydrogenase
MPERSRDSIHDIWCGRTPYHGAGQWPVRVDENLAEEPQRWVQSCCVLCTNGCGLEIGVRDGRIVGVRGRADDRVSHGRLGPKGLNAWQANASKDRLTRPLIREGGKPDGKFREASWDEAMELIVCRCKEVRETLFPKPRAGGFGLLRDLHALHVLCSDAHVATKVVKDAARMLRDDELHEQCLFLSGQNQRQLAWIDTMIKSNAAQALVVPS